MGFSDGQDRGERPARLVDFLKDMATALSGEQAHFDGFAAVRFKRAVANRDGLAFGPGDFGLVDPSPREDMRAFSFRTGKFSLVRTGSFDVLPPDTPLPGDALSFRPYSGDVAETEYPGGDGLPRP
jgi:hypothetical protein